MRIQSTVHNSPPSEASKLLNTQDGPTDAAGMPNPGNIKRPEDYEVEAETTKAMAETLLASSSARADAEMAPSSGSQLRSSSSGVKKKKKKWTRPRKTQKQRKREKKKGLRDERGVGRPSE